MDARHASRWRVGRGVPRQCGALRAQFKLLSYPGLRRPPGASPGGMHGAALRAELGRSDDLLCPVRAENHHHSISMFLRRRRLTMLNPRL